MVAVLTLLCVFSFVDRQIFSLLVAPLRRDLRISDTQISLLMGFSFALFCTFFGIPIGHLADVYNRVAFLLFLAPSAAWATFWLIPAAALAAALFGVAPAAIQQMMPPEMRGQASAVCLFIVNIIGLGIGPTAVGAVTQYLFRREDAVPYSLALVTSLACALGAVLLYGALRPFLASLDRLRDRGAEGA